MAQRQLWTKNAHDHKDDSEEEEEEEETVLLHANGLNMSCVGSAHHNGVVATLAGCVAAENQDRALLCSPWKGALLLGVFDGHDDDGEAISEHVKNELPKRLAEKLKNQHDDNNNDNDDIFVKAFKETFCELHDSLPAASAGGCTASCILKWNTKLYIANGGDSMSMICAARNGKTPEIVFQTRRDIPELHEERERIERMGGAVVSGRVAYHDKEGQMRPGVAMSRSIGDSDMIGVIAEPIVNVLDMRQLVDEENRILCISATDGMTDCIPPPELVESLADAFHGKDDGHAFTAAQDLVLRAAKVWKTKTGGLYRDDITIVACSIEY